MDIGWQALPGPTLLFTMDLTKGSVDMELSKDTYTTSSWKRPVASQRRTRDRLRNLLSSFGPRQEVAPLLVKVVCVVCLCVFVCVCCVCVCVLCVCAFACVYVYVYFICFSLLDSSAFPSFYHRVVKSLKQSSMNTPQLPQSKMTMRTGCLSSMKSPNRGKRR